MVKGVNAKMKSEPVPQELFPLPLIILVILAGAVLLSVLFFSFWQKLNQKVEIILKDQFNQQQLMLARKIADNVESYFDFLENALLGYAGLVSNHPSPGTGHRMTSWRKGFPGTSASASWRSRATIAAGVGVQVFSTAPTPPPAGSLDSCPPPYLQWARDPSPPRPPLPEQDLRLPRASLAGPPGHARSSPRSTGGRNGRSAGVLEFLIDPFFICEQSHGRRALRPDRLRLDHRPGRNHAGPL